MKTEDLKVDTWRGYKNYTRITHLPSGKYVEFTNGSGAEIRNAALELLRRIVRQNKGF